MKKLFFIPLLSLVFVAVVFPAVASAQSNPCGPGYEWDGQECFPSVSSGGTGGSAGSPVVSGNTGAINPTYIQGYKDSIIWVINQVLVPILTAIAFIVFLYGVYKYLILGAADETARATGRQYVLWGIIGFVIIFAVWGLVNIVSGTLGLPTGGSTPTPPTL